MAVSGLSKSTLGDEALQPLVDWERQIYLLLLFF